MSDSLTHTLQSDLKLPVYIKKDGNFYLNEKTDRYLTHAQLNQILRTYKKRKEFIAKRQKEYLKLLCQDLTNSEIAKIMNVSPRTVDTYRDGLLEKTKSRSRVGLVIYAIKNGIVAI